MNSLIACRDLAAEFDVGIHTHLAEFESASRGRLATLWDVR